jgi:toxin ParE1/3/4
MKAYRLTEAADGHLREIWRYARDRWSAAQADAYLARIEAAIEAAIATPTLLRPRPEIGAGVVARRAVSHIVYGRVAGEMLIVIGVLHARMDPRRHLHTEAG